MNMMNITSIAAAATLLVCAAAQADPGDAYKLVEYQIPVMHYGYEVGFIPKPTGRLVNARKPVTAHTLQTEMSNSELFMQIPGSFFAYHNISLNTSLAPVALPALDAGSFGPVQSMRLSSDDRSPALNYFTGELGITKNLKQGYPEGKRVVEPVAAQRSIAVLDGGIFIEGRPIDPALCCTKAPAKYK